MRAPCLFLLLIVPSVLPAEDVQVRVYSAHPPASLTVMAIEGRLHWRSCPACPEETGQSLTVESAKASTPARTKDAQKEFFITGIAAAPQPPAAKPGRRCPSLTSRSVPIPIA